MSVTARGIVSIAAIAAALSTVALGACSAGPSASTSATSRPTAAEPTISMAPPTIATIPRLASTTGLRLPIEAYRPTSAQQNVVDDAVAKLTTECMAGYGLSYPFTPSNLPDIYETTREYGIGDLATAKTYGYHNPIRQITDRAKAATSKAANGNAPVTSATTTLVLLGSATGDHPIPGTKVSYRGRAVPEGGCAGQARRTVTGADNIDPVNLADSILVDMWRRSQADPRVVAVIGAWSTCMSRAGFQYSSPMAATGDPAWTNAPIGPHEIAVAMTDVRCKQKSNLIGIWFSVESAYENAAIAQNLAQVTSAHDAWVAAARNGSRILDVPDPPRTATIPSSR